MGRSRYVLFLTNVTYCFSYLNPFTLNTIRSRCLTIIAVDTTSFSIAWINILAQVNETQPGAGVQDILQAHYKVYGRNFFSRYDYEEVESDGANRMIERLRSQISGGELVGKTFGGFTVAKADDFSYTDPIDASVSAKQVRDEEN